MSDRIYNVLFLCTGNSARSILAESILRKDGGGGFRAFSAGSAPKGQVNPFALRVLESLDYPTDGMRSKSWTEFAAADAPVMDFVFTVCDSAAGEVLSGMARSANDSALGHRGSLRRRRGGPSKTHGILDRLSIPEKQDCSLHGLANRRHRSPFLGYEAARNRAH